MIIKGSKYLNSNQTTTLVPMSGFTIVIIVHSIHESCIKSNDKILHEESSPNVTLNIYIGLRYELFVYLQRYVDYFMAIFSIHTSEKQ